MALRRLSVCAVVLALAATLAGPVAATARRVEPKPLFPKNRAVLNDPQFQWKPVAGAITYRLEVAVDHRFTNIAYTIDTAATRYMDTAAWPAASYWWRVKVVAPYEGSYSNVRSFTRRWLGPRSGATDVARPDNVVVEDFASEPGIQVPSNAVKISWDPVPDASYYEIQFDGRDDMICSTPHTVLTPYLSGSIGDSETGTGTGDVCNPTLDQGTHWLRVRAVDVTVTDAKLFSLWSDEARSLEAAVPNPVIFSLGPNLTGPAEAQPAVLARPRNGMVFLDMPTFEWEPVAWASEYQLVLSLDQDFTNVIGRFRTTNTRLIPVGRLPENTAVRSYYWFVVPCVKADGKTVSCLNENRAVNRQGKFRSFKKQSVLVKAKKTVRRKTPWVEFVWEAYTTTMNRFARRTGADGSSMGGIKWYEMQLRPKGASWDSARTINTDLPGTLPTDLRLGGRFQWRVRPVDETGQARPWSNTRFVRTRIAAPANPVALKAFRSRTRVTLLWRTPKSRYFPVTGYSVYYSTKGKRWKPLTIVNRNRAAFKVRKGTAYWFMVTAINAAGESAPSRVFVRR